MKATYIHDHVSYASPIHKRVLTRTFRAGLPTPAEVLYSLASLANRRIFLYNALWVTYAIETSEEALSETVLSGGKEFLICGYLIICYSSRPHHEGSNGGVDRWQPLRRGVALSPLRLR